MHSQMRKVGMILCLIVCASCATYYQQNFDFNTEFEKGNLAQALKTLQQKDELANGRNRFIYFANNGILLSILGRYEESNDYLEKAFIFGEDYHINYIREAASYFTNPQTTVYRGEDHEHLMVLYFKAINYLKMSKPEEALVECRRLNIRLNQLNDKYASDKKFQRDAFVHTLMGIIYQSTQDYNNAFIAYRNALEIYESDYQSLFKIPVPEQLKKDLLNTAWLTGFKDEFESFKEKFNMPDHRPYKPEAELVFFWHNGLSPVKKEWGINFAIERGTDNMIFFTNSDMGISFPFYVKNDKEKSDLKDLSIFRVAFPKYTERYTYYESATLNTDSIEQKLELGEDINQIAFYSLKQRMMLEFSKGLLRAALKKTTEESVRKKDEGLGALIGLVNAFTEKADTRNWQTLPHSIYYSRVPLKTGTNEVTFTLSTGSGEVKHNFSYKAQQNQTLFHTFSSLESSIIPNKGIENSTASD